MIGVNLGGWLVLERWMTPSVFEGTKAIDEFSLSSLGEKYRKRIRKHHATFITEQDFQWLKEQGIEIIRLPIGYWIFGDEKPYVKSINRLDWAFTMAEKYQLKILLDIHAAPGSQNGQDHSGQQGEIGWAKDPENQIKLEYVTLKLVERYQEYSCFWGIGLLNETHIKTKEFSTYWGYYRAVVPKVRSIKKGLKIIIDGYQPLFGLAFALKNKTLLDLHYYPAMGKTRMRPNQRILIFTKIYGWFLQILSWLRPVIIGEWSLAMGHYYDMLPKEQKTVMNQTYIKAQLKAFKPAKANFYWSYKTEDQSLWSYRDNRHKLEDLA